MANPIGPYILEALLALDKDVNGITGGDETQTISARAYAIELAEVDSFWRIVIDRLFYEGHCKNAWDTYMEALNAPNARS